MSRRNTGGFIGVEVPYPTYDPEYGLSLTRTDSTGSLTNSNFTRTTDAVFACDLTWPSSFSSTGLIMELGASTLGCGIGLRASGGTLRVIAGDGSTVSSSTDTAVANYSTSNLTPSESGTLVWEFRVNPGRVRMWWNGNLIGEDDTTAGGALDGSVWAGADNGHFGGSTSSGIHTGLANANFPGTIDSTLRYYENQLAAENLSGSGMWNINALHEALVQ